MPYILFFLVCLHFLSNSLFFTRFLEFFSPFLSLAGQFSVESDQKCSMSLKYFFFSFVFLFEKKKPWIFCSFWMEMVIYYNLLMAFTIKCVVIKIVVERRSTNIYFTSIEWNWKENSYAVDRLKASRHNLTDPGFDLNTSNAKCDEVYAILYSWFFIESNRTIDEITSETKIIFNCRGLKIGFVTKESVLLRVQIFTRYLLTAFHQFLQVETLCWEFQQINCLPSLLIFRKWFWNSQSEIMELLLSKIQDFAFENLRFDVRQMSGKRKSRCEPKI